jgi:hypothetical protein
MQISLAEKKGQVQPIEFYDRSLRTGQELATIANVGLTAKLIDSKTTEILWVYQDSCREKTLREGMNLMVERMLGSLLAQTSGKASASSNAFAERSIRPAQLPLRPAPLSADAPAGVKPASSTMPSIPTPAPRVLSAVKPVASPATRPAQR